MDWYIAGVVAIMILAGILGGLYGYFADRTAAPPPDPAPILPTPGTPPDPVAPAAAPQSALSTQPVYALVIFGIVASFLIPLFLSIAKSQLFTEVIAGTKYAENMFILFAFCLLAATSARSFVDALAKKALNEAQSAKQEAQTATKKAVDAANLASSAEVKADVARDVATDNSAENSPGVATDPAIMESAKVTVSRDFAHTPEEKAVLNALLNPAYTRRSLTGIANDAGLDRNAARQALQSLIQKNAVKEMPSKTGALLYEATLAGK